MAKKKDLLKDKLNALNPSIPTNTRGVAAKEDQAGRSAPDTQNKTRKKLAEKTKPRVGRKPAAGKASPEMKQEPEAAPKPRPASKDMPEGPWLLSALMQENLFALNRMNETIFEINRSFFDSYRRCTGICFENLGRSCFWSPRFPAGKWPFTF